VTKKQNGYERYALSADGISPRSMVGVGNHIVANSDEHSTDGFTSEEIKDRDEQMEKRMQKMATCEKEDLLEPKLYGPKDAKLTIVGWGSSKGAILEAMKDLPHVNFLHCTWLSPFPATAIKKVLQKSKKILNIELNFTGQLGGLIQEKTGIALPHQLLKYNGRPLFPEEVILAAKKLL
jgi:2-oxoglutarate ferredoxin oxidoreductase subunit alpha